MITRELMAEWVEDALQSLGGRASILDICKKVWTDHGDEITTSDDLFYEWQYEIRWAGDIRRKQGVLIASSGSERGMWQLATNPGS